MLAEAVDALRVTVQEAANPTANIDSRRATLNAMVARRRESLRREQEERQATEDLTTERWSGLRISKRCVRAEKWDASMCGKILVRFSDLGKYTPDSRDCVFIGVLLSRGAPSGLGSTTGGERLAEWILTDLDKSSPRTLTLVLGSRALEHWVDSDGPGRACSTVGSIFGVLNPRLARRNTVLSVKFETQLIKLGNCPSLAFCEVALANGRSCRQPYNAEGGQGLCHQHAKMSHGERQLQREARPHQCRRTAKILTPLSAGIRPTIAKDQPSKLQSSSAFEQSFSEPELLVNGLHGGLEGIAGRASRILVDESSSVAEIVSVLEELEVAALPADTVIQAGLYDKVGHVVRRANVAGPPARRLRRTWRVLLDGTGQQGTPATEMPPNCLDTTSSWPAAKRVRNCGK